jgi:RimJ/RimL family protein N-acetyltransferase
LVKAPRQIETARLVLVEPRITDAAEIFDRYASDPDVTRYLSWPQHRSVADTYAFLRFSAGQWERWPAGPYLIRARTDGRLMGGTGLAFESPREAATGYVLAKHVWGMGYATEALCEVVRVARRLGVTRLYALCHPCHPASQRVLEKCGFRPDACGNRLAEFPNLAPGVLQEVLCYVVSPAVNLAPGSQLLD